MDDDLTAAVAASYRAFSRYRFDGACGYGPAGLGPLEIRLLRVTPPPDVPRDLLAAYVGALPAAPGGRAADDLRALLPRLFELIAIGAFPEDCARRAVGVLARSGFERWPAPEAAAVTTFLAAWPGAAASPVPAEPSDAGSG